ncbi:MAG: hypothetical protein ACHQUC_00120 [Chlamydiales bacterium]
MQPAITNSLSSNIDSTPSSASSTEQAGVNNRGNSVSSFIQLNRTVSKLLDKALEISAYACVVFYALGAALYDWGLNAEISFKASSFSFWTTAGLLVVKGLHEVYKYFYVNK